MPACKRFFPSLLIALGLPACTKASTGSHPLEIPPDLPPIEEWDEETELTPTTPAPGVVCPWKRRSFQIGGTETPVYANWTYVAETVQGKSVRLGGPPDGLNLRRSGGWITITNPNGSVLSSVWVDQVSQASVTTAVNEILRAFPEDRLAAQIEFSIKQLRSREETKLALRAGGDFFGIFDFESNFQYRDDYRVSTFLVALRQRYYTAAFEGHAKPEDFFAPGVLDAYRGPQISEDNPPGYISSVTFGRVFYLLVQSTESAERMSATLSANLELGIFGGGGDGSLKYLTDAAGLTIQAYAYGGEQGAVLDAIFGGLGKLNSFKESLKKGNDVLTALPLSHVVKSLSTNQVIQYAISADYDYATCTLPDACKPKLLSPIGGGQDNGCDGENNVSWSFDWSDCSGAPKYELQVIRPNGSVFLDKETSTSSYKYTGTAGSKDEAGWHWKVRPFDLGAWQAWTSEASFSLEPFNTDCPPKGVILYALPRHEGASIFIPYKKNTLVSLRDYYPGWDNFADSIKLVNVPGVQLLDDPAVPWWAFVTHSCPLFPEHAYGPPFNTLSAIRFY